MEVNSFKGKKKENNNFLKRYKLTVIFFFFFHEEGETKNTKETRCEERNKQLGTHPTVSCDFGVPVSK